jgi:hypothetical protein
MVARAHDKNKRPLPNKNVVFLPFSFYIFIFFNLEMTSTILSEEKLNTYFIGKYYSIKQCL